MEFIRINNRKNFLIKEVREDIYPESASHLRYWKLQKKRCIEGFWSIDDANVNLDYTEIDLLNIEETHKSNREHWRWMPPNLYFYVNFGTILKKLPNSPKSAPKKKGRPELRDVEWEFFYCWTEARGFSGFELDDINSCNRDILLYNRNEIDISDLHTSCFSSNGEVKNYIPARVYLRQLFPDPLGRPLYENAAKNLFMLGCRGFGKSYMVGGGIIAHELLFDGAKYYTEESIKNPATVEIFVGAAISSKSADILSKTKLTVDEMRGKWARNTPEEQPSPFSKILTGSLQPNNMKNPWINKYKKKIAGDWRDVGTGSNIKHGIYTIENPEAAAGTRPTVMAIEEVGLLPNVLNVHGSNTECMMEGSIKFGSAVYLGTGGNIQKIVESQILFYDPEGFDFLSFENNWEPQDTRKIGFFISAPYKDNKFKDKNGNTDFEKALDHYKKIREVKKKANDASALNLEMMNNPLIPSEMFLNANQNNFPIKLLTEQKGEIEGNPQKYKNAFWIGDLVISAEGKIKFEYTNPNDVVYDFPIKDSKNKPGAIEIYELPKKNSKGWVFSNRYIIGIDPYDDDDADTNSLGCIIVFDLFTDRIVAEFTGRRKAKDFYEIARRLCIFYNAEANYEQNKKGLFGYFDNRNCAHYLCDVPKYLSDTHNIRISKVGNNRKGTYINGPVKNHGIELIEGWLEERIGDKELLNLHFIRSVGLLKELVYFNKENGNYDRISALIMVLILREEKLKYLNLREKDQGNKKPLSQDPFFKNYFKTKS